MGVAGCAFGEGLEQLEPFRQALLDVGRRMKRGAEIRAGALGPADDEAAGIEGGPLLVREPVAVALAVGGQQEGSWVSSVLIVDNDVGACDTLAGILRVKGHQALVLS